LKRSIAVSCQTYLPGRTSSGSRASDGGAWRGDDELGVTKTIVLPEPARSSLILTASATALTEVVKFKAF
jgi:hypothetical protein